MARAGRPGAASVAALAAAVLALAIECSSPPPPPRVAPSTLVAPPADTADAADPVDAGADCVVRCVASRQMQATSPQNIEDGCRRDCADPRYAPP